jgi:LexA-binding, inner membrane-associated putative hydrolase
MADFKTHLVVASTLSGVLAIGTLVAGVATPKETLVYFCAGTIGGVLPDLDSDHALPVQILFGLLAIVLAFLSVFSRAETYSIVELACVWIAVFFIIRYIPYKIFIRFTRHRGIFHSLLAALFFGLFSTAIAYHLFGLNALTAWLTGCFVAIGYVIHLTLDEMYSVDVTGAKIKKSFGTALKFASANLKTSSILGVATVLVFFLATPTLDTFLQTLGNGRVYASFYDRFLPKDRLFNLPFPGRTETAGGSDNQIDHTGSISHSK